MRTQLLNPESPISTVPKKSHAGRPKETPKTLPGEAKRLNQIIEEFGGTYKDFAKLIPVSESAVSYWANGKRAIPSYAIKAICFRLGYAMEWFIFGTGPRKAKREDVKLITEVKELRAEMQMMLQENRAMKARMIAYEKDLEELKALILSTK